MARGKSGLRTSAIQQEFQNVTSLIQSKQLPQMSHLSRHNVGLRGPCCRKFPSATPCISSQNKIDVWRFRLSNFDEESPGGKQLNLDLAALKQSHQQDHILMEATFPADYPTQPFSLRVISPRCCWYTGHVTPGGSVCIEALADTGTAVGWQKTSSFANVMRQVLAFIVDASAQSPGGVSGPLRVDLKPRRRDVVMVEYGEEDARSSFTRMAKHYKQHGWPAYPATKMAPSPAPCTRSRSATMQPPAPVGSSSAPRAPTTPSARKPAKVQASSAKAHPARTKPAAAAAKAQATLVKPSAVLPVTTAITATALMPSAPAPTLTAMAPGLAPTAAAGGAAAMHVGSSSLQPPEYWKPHLPGQEQETMFVILPWADDEAAVAAEVGAASALSSSKKRKRDDDPDFTAVMTQMKQEAEMVARKWEEGGQLGQSRSKIVRIERVQSLPLWNKYKRRKE